MGPEEHEVPSCNHPVRLGSEQVVSLQLVYPRVRGAGCHPVRQSQCQAVRHERPPSGTTPEELAATRSLSNGLQHRLVRVHRRRQAKPFHLRLRQSDAGLEHST